MSARLTRLAVLAAGALAAIGANAANIGMGSNGWFTPTLENNLTGQGNNVTVVDSYTEQSLAGFDVYIQDGNSYFDQAALQSFVFNGGTLLELPWSLNQNDYYSGALNLIDHVQNWVSFASPNPAINALDPTNPLLNGVSLPAAGQYTVGYELHASFSGNGTPILSWGTGDALLAQGTYGAGRVVAFNLHLITSDSSPLNADWSNQIVYNTVAAVPEPSTYALMLAGLCALGMWSRRRRQS